MENENIEIENEQNEDYIETIKKLKANSVPKEKYEELMKEKKDLLQAIVDGESISPEEQETPKSIEELRKEYFKEDQTNLEMAENTLALRKAIMDQGGQDPFLPYGATASITQADIDGAEKTAKYLEHCIEVADGDPGVFNTEFQRGLKDAMPVSKLNFRK